MIGSFLKAPGGLKVFEKTPDQPDLLKAWANFTRSISVVIEVIPSPEQQYLRKRQLKEDLSISFTECGLDTLQDKLHALSVRVCTSKHSKYCLSVFWTCQVCGASTCNLCQVGLDF